MSAPGECAYQIIMSTEILGISHMEREMVASIVRYNTMELPNFSEFDGKLGNDEYLIVMKLAAILRVCNALDRSHRQKFADMRLTIKDSNIVITTAYPDNITLEKKTLQDKQDFFEEVYGLGFEIKQKKNRAGAGGYSHHRLRILYDLPGEAPEAPLHRAQRRDHIAH